MKLSQFKHILFGEKLNLKDELSEELANRYFAEDILNRKSQQFREIPIDKILQVLQDTANKLTDKKGFYYKELINKMPGITNYSVDMVKKAVELIPEMLSINALKKRLQCIGNYHSLDYFINDTCSKANRVVPIGSVLHVAAGNIFLGSIDSLVIGIITKNVNILKVSSEDFLFPVLFYEALMEVDKDKVIVPYIAMTYWRSNNKNVETIVKNNFDAILLFGGEKAVLNYKNGLSAKTDIYSFGPKISFGLVCNNLEDNELINAAKGFAKDIVCWEQRACTSCQNIFIESSNKDEKFIEYLTESLENLAREFPQNKLTLDSALEIRKEREIAKWNEFNNNCRVIEGKNAAHTIIVQKSNDFINSPLNRTVYVNIVENYQDIFKGNLKELKYYMSTLGVVSKEKLQDIIENFMKYGVMRFCKPGSMNESNDESQAHDGKHLASLLVKYINKEDLEDNNFGLEFIEKKKKEEILLSKLNVLLKEAMKAPFYKEFYKNIKLPLKSLDEFKKVPILEKKYMFNNSIDKSNHMLTREMKQCYVFSAGGTTGKMKYVAYSNKEFEDSEKAFGKGFKAVGINEKDFVANYMKAGALWTAFSAVNKGIEEVGCKILSLTANQSEKETIEYLKIFKPNVIIGLPGNIILLTREIEKLNESIKIEKVYYAGEHISEKSQEYVKKILGAEVIASFGYAAVEIGPIGFQCESCKGTEHHVMDEWCYLESDENGEAIVTALNKTLHPIIRYRIGDKIQWVNSPCACGRTSKKFKLLSRTDDVVRFNVSDIYLNDVYDTLKDVKEVSSFFQIVVENVDNMRDVTFKIETKNENIPTKNEQLTKKIQYLLKTNIKSIGKDYRENLINNINVQLLAPCTIERVGRTGKIRRIIDKRI
ncbi:acyl-CoA reductase [Haloimpatiens sp. FM7330]|uniref:acyl-CoA reductase n=1 Tax=Haloimpatiens sp. FM7330 TaxID=3298610 RepID=UPI00363A5830